jgi:4-alpha-glucanotransferase
MKVEKNKRQEISRSLKRNSGVLMHITSLPGPYGIGDLGKEAQKFADFLKRSHQTYWQLLPLNPIEAGGSYSPYSSTSAFAGNILLISPDVLFENGLLDRSDLRSARKKSSDRTDYAHAHQTKEKLFEKAFQNFRNEKSEKKKELFERFCLAEKGWLEHYACYVVLKKIFHRAPWYEWPREYKIADMVALKAFLGKYREDLDKVKWLQYIFFQQWTDLKTYCNSLGIYFVGDLPFYVSHDSVDVWSVPEIFSIDSAGNMKFMAGVPPDYFNAGGQLWGMPVFRWDELKKQKYFWWVSRVKKNMELYDMLRLDHFRAFSDYWAVPFGETTARTGTWEKGPGKGLFEALKKELGSLPFIAEDLGDINDDVRNLRLQFHLPGMKVLQFAFGDNMASSEYIPHNYSENFVVYTGTHDNNTTRGWYRKDTAIVERRHLQQYLDRKISAAKIHTHLIRLAFSSVAKTAIIPIQDLLGLDEKSRMNSPATTLNNWRWRMPPGALDRSLENWLKEQTVIHNRF